MVHQFSPMFLTRHCYFQCMIRRSMLSKRHWTSTAWKKKTLTTIALARYAYFCSIEINHLYFLQRFFTRVQTTRRHKRNNSYWMMKTVHSVSSCNTTHHMVSTSFCLFFFSLLHFQNLFINIIQSKLFHAAWSLCSFLRGVYASFMSTFSTI
jgi:hypothetical protein